MNRTDCGLIFVTTTERFGHSDWRNVLMKTSSTAAQFWDGVVFGHGLPSVTLRLTSMTRRFGNSGVCSRGLFLHSGLRTALLNLGRLRLSDVIGLEVKFTQVNPLTTLNGSNHGVCEDLDSPAVIQSRMLRSLTCGTITDGRKCVLDESISKSRIRDGFQ